MSDDERKDLLSSSVTDTFTHAEMLKYGKRVRRETIEACIRAADAGERECITGCHQRLRDLLQTSTE